MSVLRPIQKEYYGDDHRWFLGYVINSSPPSGLEGRVKVRIIGVHNKDTNEIPERDLPWAQVLIPTTEGGSSGIGRIPQLTNGAFVFGIFLDGISSQTPLVIGSLPHTEIPTTVQRNRLAPTDDNKFAYDQTRIQNVVAYPMFDDETPRGDVGIRRQQCVKFMLDNGYNLIHAAAITGGLQSVSSFVTASGTSLEGIGGWKVDATIGSRYASLLKFSGNYSPSIDWQLFSTQLQFVVFELRTRFNLANSKLLAAKNIKDASEVINKYYLKSNSSTHQIAQRVYDEVLSI